ncbi:MAG: PEP-CTERM sorting domain-containing protein [Kiritimatiellia bacterium]
MKKSILLPCIFLIAAASISPADLITQFNFTSGSASPDTELSNTSSTDFLRGPGLDGSLDGDPALLFTNNRAEFRPPLSSNSDSTNLDNGEYGFFTINADSGFQLNLQNITYNTARAGSSPDQMAVYYSLDSGTTKTKVGEVSANSSGNHDLSGSGFQGISTIDFYFVPNGNNSTTTDQSRFVSVDSVEVNGTAIPEPGTLVMMTLALGTMLLFRRRKG